MQTNLFLARIVNCAVPLLRNGFGFASVPRLVPPADALFLFGFARFPWRTKKLKSFRAGGGVGGFGGRELLPVKTLQLGNDLVVALAM